MSRRIWNGRCSSLGGMPRAHLTEAGMLYARAPSSYILSYEGGCSKACPRICLLLDGARVRLIARAPDANPRAPPRASPVILPSALLFLFPHCRRSLLVVAFAPRHPSPPVSRPQSHSIILTLACDLLCVRKGTGIKNAYNSMQSSVASLGDRYQKDISRCCEDC